MSAANPSVVPLFLNGGKDAFENEIALLESTMDNAGYHMVHDPFVRIRYNQLVKQFSQELRSRAIAGTLSWQQAALEASELRNVVMERLRTFTTPYGRAQAQSMKGSGLSLNQLVARYTTKLYGEHANFSRLSNIKKNRVYAEIVRASGSPNPRVNFMMRRMSYAGRSLLILSLAISAYQIAIAENKGRATARESSVTLAAIGGGMAGGATAGIVCGPGAPVCVAIGAFVGGTLAAFSIDMAWE